MKGHYVDITNLTAIEIFETIGIMKPSQAEIDKLEMLLLKYLKRYRKNKKLTVRCN